MSKEEQIAELFRLKSVISCDEHNKTEEEIKMWCDVVQRAINTINNLVR